MTGVRNDVPTGSPGGAIDLEHLRQVVNTRVFGATDPVVIGRYTLQERIGSGAMGVVYAAHDGELDRTVAVKVLRSGGVGGRRRLVREAQALARVNHPNVVHIYEVGEHGDEVFLAMELVRGTPLRSWLHEVSRSPTEILAHFAAAARGLGAAHGHGVVHRDVKADNIVVGDDGRVRVIDFGLAVGLASDEEAPASGPTLAPVALAGGLTQTGQRMGTPAYMAPEQVRGEAPDPRADQFSLCASLFEALTGDLPFPERSGQEPVTRDGAALRWGGHSIPARVRKAVTKGLSERPEDRFESMDALADQLDRTRRPARDRMVAVAAVGVAVAGLGVAGWSTSFGAPPAAAVAEVSSATPSEDALIVSAARGLVATDPTAAWARLAALPKDSPAWGAGAWAVAADAWDAGVAVDEATWPDAGLVATVDRGRVVAMGDDGDLALVDATGAVLWRRPADDPDLRGRGLHARHRTLLYMHAGRLLLTDFETESDLGPYDSHTHWAVTPGGRTVITRGTTVSVWSPRGTLEATYEQRGPLDAAGVGDGRLSSVRVASLDGRWVQLSFAPAAEGWRTGLLDVETGAARWFPWDVVSVRASAAGELYTQHRDGRLARWTESPDPPRLDPDSFAVGSYVVSPDGSWVAARVPRRGVAIVDVEGGTRRWIPAPTASALLSAPDGSSLALVEGQSVRVVTPHGQIVRTLRHPERFGETRWRGTDVIETKNWAGEVRRWTIPAVPHLGAHGGGVTGMAFAGDERLISLGDDRTIALWDVQTGQRTRLIDEAGGDPIGVEASIDGSFAVVTFHGGRLAAWDLETLDRVAVPEQSRGIARLTSPSTLAFNRGDEKFLWDLGTATELGPVPDAVGCKLLDVTQTGWVSGRCEDETGVRKALRVWRPGEPYVSVAGDAQMLRVSPTGEHALSTAWKGPLRKLLIDLSTGGVIRLPGGTPRGTFDLAGKRYLSMDRHGPVVRRLDVEVERSAPDWDVGVLSAVAISPDGTTIAYGTEEGDVRVRPEAMPMDPDALQQRVQSPMPYAP
ncbi:MAG: WD40 repeat domain-containing serine/threonine protein kinase [Myxococcota bacterium]